MAKKRDPVEESLAQLERDRERNKSDPRIGQLVKAARKGNAKRVTELLEQGADPNAREVGEWSWDAPISAAIAGRNPEVVRLLAKAGADLGVGFPYTPLGQSIEINNVGLVRALIEGGADVNATPKNGDDTPLDIAVSEGRAEIVGMLLDAGADPHLVSRRSKNARDGRSPLQSAAEPGRKAVLKEFIARGLVVGEGSSALLLCAAAAQGDLAEVKRLIDAGADVNAPNDQGERPLSQAAMIGRLNVVKFLLSKGAEPSPRKTRGKDDAPLVAAVRSGKLPIVQMLVEAGATDDIGLALEYAKYSRLKKIVDYLLDVRKKLAPAKKGAKKKPPRTGVPTFDLNDACLLVDGPVEAVAQAFKALVKAKTWKQDVLGEEVKLADEAFAVFRLIGQPWSIVMRLSGDNPYALLKTATARELSKSLKTRAMLVSFGDTSGIYQYLMLDKGKPVELFDTGSAADDADPDSVAKQVIAWYDMDPRKLADYQIGRGCVFASDLRKLKLASVKNALTFIEDHLARENAFVPFFGPLEIAPGERCELTIEGFGPDDIERLDYVAV